MPATPESVEAAEDYRLEQVALSAAFIAEFIALWQAALDLSQISATAGGFFEQAVGLIQRWRPEFERRAVAYLRRAAMLDGVPFTPPPPSPAVAPGRIVASLMATLHTYTRARDAGRSPADAGETALSQASGDAVRLAREAGRQAIERSVRADPRAVGWMRITDGNPCAFCLMLASRGPVYKTRESAGFAIDPVRGEINRFHPHCGCEVIPVYTRAPREHPSNRDARRTWGEAQAAATRAGELRRGTSNDALNALRRHLAAQGRK